jgi:AhpD family alkylhydroperoxidase
MSQKIEEFKQFRDKMNQRILGSNHLEIKRFFALDSAAYRDGALPGKVKELLGLVASLVLRCNDCVTYHLLRCVESGYSDEEIIDAFNVALVVGGSIVIPHLRVAFARLDEIRSRSS